MPPFIHDFLAALSSANYTFFIIALIFIILDIVTGVAKSASQHNVSSTIMRKGFWHKLAIILALLVALLTDAVVSMGLDIGVNVPIFEAACAYVVVMELVSILENIKVMNPELDDSPLLKLFGTHLDDDKKENEDKENESSGEVNTDGKEGKTQQVR